MSRGHNGPVPGERDNFGLLANGSSGNWEVSVDETTSEPDRWFVQIEGPSTYCSFEIPSPQIVSEAVRFISGGDNRGGPFPTDPNPSTSMALGKFSETPVALIRDDEYPDRYFLVIGPDSAVVRLSIAGQDLKDLAEALRQATEDMEDD